MTDRPRARSPHRPTWSLVAASALALVTSATAAAASDPASNGDPASASAEPSSKPPPRPRTGWTLQGLPILKFNTDEGFGYGGQLIAVDRADGTWKPWRASILLQYFATTAEIFSHRLVVDLPRVFDSAWRFTLELQYSRHRFNPYYGLGNTSEYVAAHARCADRAALASDPDVCADNPEFRGLRYYSYELGGTPRVLLNVRRHLGGAWHLLLGHRLRFEQVRLQYSPDELGQTRPSRLTEDAGFGRFAGLEGGATAAIAQRTSELTVGVQYDSRDHEVSASEGMFHEVAVRGAARALGSGFEYWGATLHARGWLSPLGPDARLVVALRGAVDVMGGDVPVSLLPYFGGLDGKEALGGVHSVRGLLRNRYQGPVKLLTNAELRWMPLTVEPFGQRLDLGLVGFLDTGRVWSDFRLADGGGLKASAGGGLRVVWNQLFVVRADCGFGLSDPTSGFYLEFGQLF